MQSCRSGRTLVKQAARAAVNTGIHNMRIVTALSMVAGSILATMALTSMMHRQMSYTDIDPAALVEPASAESLLVKSSTGPWKELRLKPLSEVGDWRVECDGSLFDYYGVTLGKATDQAHDLGCDVWEVSAIGGVL